jgi:hypothetical protein
MKGLKCIIPIISIILLFLFIFNLLPNKTYNPYLNEKI